MVHYKYKRFLRNGVISISVYQVIRVLIGNSLRDKRTIDNKQIIKSI